MLVDDVIGEVLPETISALILYTAGFSTSLILSRLRKRTTESKLKERTRIAIDAIYEAEQKVKGDKRGSERMAYATKELMDNAKINDYEEAQRIISQVFTFTRLSNNNHTHKRR